MSERIYKFIACLIVVPFLALTLLMLVPIVLLIPFVALVYPEAINIDKNEEDETDLPVEKKEPI